ncbi:2,3-diaminopropionate biosynthesis protein SbnA [Arenibacter algicola]|uniref:2,3-diaminopropionate biosynthesis protein SbnA n=1 Tax=Arenibacter algicola TaxID=616991 RepID=UPI001C06B32D|nr:2,3-diaminopropionate biosynthesis protein SbnA [Arenibacter algicola]MBU2905950.1 2,3-diaminopropionate biosynthesis protein SbnA [Arenibacter algicola]
MNRIASHIMDSIGNTPLIRLNRMFEDSKLVYAKMEGFNPAGSMKDRSASRIVYELMREGKLQKGGTVIESSSGNMAVGLAQACLFHGLNLKVVVDPNLNPHTKKLLEVYGAEIIVVHQPNSEGGFLGARLNKVKELLYSVPNSVWSNQYRNPNNPKAYHQTMEEIMQQLNKQVDYIFIATSTCGSLMGCSDYIKKHKLDTKLVAVDAIGSVLFGGPSKLRKIPGHGAGMPSQFLIPDRVYDVMHVADIDCIKGCMKLLKEEAILAGGSSGGVVSAYLRYQYKLPENSVSVLLFPDKGERYLDTVYNPKWIRENFISDQISSEFQNGRVLKNYNQFIEHESL